MRAILEGWSISNPYTGGRVSDSPMTYLETARPPSGAEAAFCIIPASAFGTPPSQNPPAIFTTIAVYYGTVGTLLQHPGMYAAK